MRKTPIFETGNENNIDSVGHKVSLFLTLIGIFGLFIFMYDF